MLHLPRLSWRYMHACSWHGPVLQCRFNEAARCSTLQLSGAGMQTVGSMLTWLFWGLKLRGSWAGVSVRARRLPLRRYVRPGGYGMQPVRSTLVGSSVPRGQLSDVLRGSPPCTDMHHSKSDISGSVAQLPINEGRLRIEEKICKIANQKSVRLAQRSRHVMEHRGQNVLA